MVVDAIYSAVLLPMDDAVGEIGWCGTGPPDPPILGGGQCLEGTLPTRLSPRIGGEVAKPERGPHPHQPTSPAA